MIRSLPRDGPSPNGQQTPRAGLPGGRGEPLRVLIADPDGLARSAMRTALLEVYCVAVVLLADHAREALELARYYRPTVTIVDIAIPPESGVQVIRRVKAAAPATRVLTVSVDHQHAIAGLRAGAIGHVRKDVDPHELARLVVRAAAEEAIVPQRLLMPLLELVREIPETGWRPLHSRLTNREWEMIELIANGATTQQIAERLVLSPTTVYSHVKSVLRKLGVHSRREAVAAAERLRREEASGTDSLGPIRAKSSA